MKFVKMSLDEALRCKMQDKAAQEEYNQKEEAWLNSERMD